jgi:translation initiation factor 2B subunit (eIF-2B alpha/beta/delta family)
MHPIERLRYVARAGDDAPSMLVRESAAALASFNRDPAALVTACRRLVDRQAHAASIWWLAARVLVAADPAHEAWLAADAVDEDTTPIQLIDHLPPDAKVLVLGWPETIAPAIAKRGDLDVFVVDTLDQGSGFVRRLERAGLEPTLVDERGVGAAAAYVDVVLLDAMGLGSGLGGDSISALTGSHAAAAVARAAGKQVWAAAGVGRVLPGRVWDAYAQRLDDASDPWDNELEMVPLSLIHTVVGPDGLSTPADALKRADCPIAPELLKSLD